MADIVKYVPIIKSRGFAPSPVASAGGPPDYANSQLNPKVVGTIAYEDWWNEEIRRCLEGYQTGGIVIPGRYYYYLNYCLIHTVGRGYHYPDFTDTDLEFFRMVDFCKADGIYKGDKTAGGKGLIIPKRRRAGRSHVMAALLSYGVRFGGNGGGYRAAIVAGLSEYADDFYAKFKEDNSRKIREFFLHHLHENKDHWQAGYKLLQSRKRDGSFNEIHCLTANANENIIKGKALDDCGFEEAGEFPRLLKTYGATKACFMRGMTMIGVPYVWGTGGKMSSSGDFQSMYENADDYNLIPFVLYGNRMVPKYYIGSTNGDGEVEEDCPNIMARFGHLSKEQILGCEDVDRCLEVINAESVRLLTSRNKQPYYDHLQNHPMTIREMFLNFTGNPFTPEKISAQSYEISILPKPKYNRYLLEWKKDHKGSIESPRKVIRKVAPDNMQDYECVLMLEDYVPGYKDLDVAGIDSYDLNQSSTSKSLGSMVVVRRKDLKNGNNVRRPICMIRMRPEKKETFYDTCLMVAYYYNLLGNVLIDIEKALVMKHFQDNGGTRFLAERPRSIESKHSEQQHKYGVRLTTQSKPRMIAELQGWVDDDIDDCWFPILLDELSGYNVGKTGKESDWDAADALGIALVRILDMKKNARKADDNFDDDSDMPEWKTMRNGNVVDLNALTQQRRNEKDDDDRGYFHTTGADRFSETRKGFELPDFE